MKKDDFNEAKLYMIRDFFKLPKIDNNKVYSVIMVKKRLYPEIWIKRNKR